MLIVFLVSFALFAGCLVQSASGFGCALVAMPILTLAVDTKVAAPILTILGQIAMIGILYNNHKGLDWRMAVRLSFWSLLGTPLGLLLLKHGDERLVMGLLGGLLLSYSGYALFIEPRLRKKTNGAPVDESGWASYLGSIVAGFAGGILGGAYNVNGPPIVLYADLHRWPSAKFISVAQLYFLIHGFMILAGQFYEGLITVEVWKYCAWGIPGGFVGFFLGAWVGRKLNPYLFRLLVLVLLGVLGTVLVLR